MLEWHLQVSGILDIEPFPACLLMTHLLGYYMLCNHNQGVAE